MSFLHLFFPAAAVTATCVPFPQLCCSDTRSFFTHILHKRTIYMHTHHPPTQGANGKQDVPEWGVPLPWPPASHHRPWPFCHFSWSSPSSSPSFSSPPALLSTSRNTQLSACPPLGCHRQSLMTPPQSWRSRSHRCLRHPPCPSPAKTHQKKGNATSHPASNPTFSGLKTHKNSKNTLSNILFSSVYEMHSEDSSDITK